MSPDERDAFEHRIIDPWLAEHPVRDLTFVRESPIARLADQSPASGDVFQSVGTIEELAFILSQQARIYLADLPRQVRGEVDLMRADVLPSEDVASLQKDLHLTAAAGDRLASTAESITPLVLSERRIVLEEVRRARRRRRRFAKHRRCGFSARGCIPRRCGAARAARRSRLRPRLAAAMAGDRGAALRLS